MLLLRPIGMCTAPGISSPPRKDLFSGAHEFYPILCLYNVSDTNELCSALLIFDYDPYSSVKRRLRFANIHPTPLCNNECHVSRIAGESPCISLYAENMAGPVHLK